MCVVPPTKPCASGKVTGAMKGGWLGEGLRGAQIRSRENGTGGKQRSSERGGRTDVGVDVRGAGATEDRRTRIVVDADGGRRGGGRRDVDVNVRGYGYGPVV